ncbi:DUF6588 family protein [Mucilaginibacter ximonensis]|uniref:DUF6588 family protein n=1 Tax=Mucilaginibacter ximonensis TaxID=538021 RepID=A0ABW5YF61_9SPHI
MKKLYSLITLACVTALSFNAQAQSDDGISSLFKGGPSDVNKLVNAYSVSLFKGFGNSLNGGWTNTAKTQHFLGFSLRISATASMIPTKDKTFDINSLGLANIKPTDPNQTIAPTFGGDKNMSTGITYTDPNNPLAKYSTTLPKGVTQYVPAPQIQLTVGLIKHTDLSVRFIPTVKITDDVGKVGMFGFGLKHDIIQDFAIKGKEYPFDLAIAFGYTRLNYTKSLDVQPDNGSTVSGSTDFSNQRLEGHFNGINASLIFSKKLMFFTPFVSVGYQKSNTDVTLKGNYPFVTGATLTGKPTYTSYADPISISGSYAGLSGTRADLGFQLSLAFFKVYASYGVSSTSYNSFNAGIGFGL